MNEDPTLPDAAPPGTDHAVAQDMHRLENKLHDDAGVGLKHGVSDFSARRNDIFFAAVETTRMPMIVTDPGLPDNPVVFANKAFLTMTGYTPDEIYGHNCRFLQGPETDQKTVAEIRRAIDERRDYATEILNYRKDGYTFWNALFLSPVFDDRGELIYYFASQLDVSRRREAEDALRQAQKMEALGRLTGGIAHDFNNLLQVVGGYLELIGSGLQKPEINVEKLLRGTQNARSAVDRAAHLTQQLLSFSRKQRLEGRVLNLNDLVRGIRQITDRTIGDDVIIETSVQADLWNARIDPMQVEVALLNIIINARDAMQGRAEKRLRIATSNVTVETDTIGLYRNLGPGRYASISISDTGAGMPAEIVERVMDPFFTTKEEGKGTGLGLSMVYGFAKQSGGAAQIVSEEGVGTKVDIYFPAVDERAASTDKPRGRALDRPGTETILVVEDRADVAEMAKLILEDLGYTVLLAAHGPAALALFDRRPAIDLVFSDLIMPGGMNGVDVAREAMRRIPHVKILLTTGFAEASIERTDVGGVEFDVLNKPYGRADLARKIRVTLDGPTGVS